MPCSCCQMTDQVFGESEARSSLKSYRKHGPAEQTRELLRLVRSRGLRHVTLLDVGGGVGAIHHELLDDVAARATHVDESSAYLRAAQEEANQRGHASRVEFLQADFTDVAASLPEADIVTLDRVVCCYPDFQSLLGAAAGRTRQLLALAYPREVWYVRLGMFFINQFQALRRNPFRVFLHPISSMDSVLEASGLHRLAVRRLPVWEVALYARQ